MKKTITWETAELALEAIAFTLTREYFEETGEEPDANFIEERTKTRFRDFCFLEGIEEIITEQDE